MVQALGGASRRPVLTDVEKARKVCQAFDSTGVGNRNCFIRNGNEIHFTVDSNFKEATKICEGATELVAKHAEFSGSWKLVVFSPNSSVKPIAECWFE